MCQRELETRGEAFVILAWSLAPPYFFVPFVFFMFLREEASSTFRIEILQFPLDSFAGQWLMKIQSAIGR